ncbi:MAG: hypothetical protein AB7Q29_17860 [Vicinamibacterales bacterium]
MTTASAPHVAFIRHIAPVVAGATVTLLLIVVTDRWLIARGVLPGAGLPSYGTASLALAAAYRALFAILGCHMAARLAPKGRPRLPYAMALGVVMVLLNVTAASSMWGQTPRWYPLMGIALPLPCALIGGATAVRAIAARQAGRGRAEI